MVYLIILLGAPSYGQSFYYHQYSFPAPPWESRTTYFSFLTVYPDGSATARVRYLDDFSQSHLMELTLEDSALETSNNHRWLITRKAQPHDEPDSTFILPVFQFTKSKDDSSIQFFPSGIQGILNGKQTEADIIESQNFSYPDLTKELVHIFYNERETFVTNLFKLDTRSLTNTDRKTKMHLLIVASTNDKKIGISSRQDMVNISGYFSDLAERLGISFELKTIWGQMVSKRSVENAVQALKPAPNDIVIFYYSGHGFRSPGDKSRYPKMVLASEYTMSTLKNHTLGVEEVYNRIVKKGARLNLIFSDCCNESIDAPIPVGPSPLTTKSVGLPLSIDNCKSLFFSPRKISILATSADTTQLASGNPEIGGYFSHQLRASLNMHTSRLKSNVTWMQVLNQARQSTARQALGARCFEQRVPCQQHPWFFLK
jgi:hypothetical protein